MAWNKSTVGNSASGADYAQDSGALQAWWDAIDGAAAGDYEAEIISDIEDDVLMQNVVNAKNIWIHGDSGGSTRRKLTTASGGHVFLYVNDTDITSLLVEDLTFDGTNQNTARPGIQVISGCGTLTVNRCEFANNGQHCISITSSAATTVGNYNNVLMHNSQTGAAFLCAKTDAANSHTFQNCASFKNSNSRGFDYSDNSNITVTFWNCISMGHSFQDFAVRTSANIHLHECISYDSSATNAGHDTTDNCVANQTSTGTYFSNYASNDFHLAQDDNSNWGVNGDGAQTPALDLDSVTRSNDDVGPFEYITGGGGGSYYNNFLHQQIGN